MTKPTMFWVDLETTGLSAANDVPLEIAAVLTDDLGTPISSYHRLIWENTRQFNSAVENAISLVREMHSKSGLWGDLARTSKVVSRRTVEMEMLQWLHEEDVDPRTLPMCGASIGSLDRPFSLVHFPELNEFLHYRNVDNSSIKVLGKKFSPDLTAALDAIDSTGSDHRAVSDVMYSIEEYKVIIKHLFGA